MVQLRWLLRKEQLIVVFLLLLSLLLRAHKYWDFPLYGETEDERAWTWLGSSLLITGQPTSWSYFSPYEKYIYKRPETGPPLVRPVLDHAPLFSLIPGSVHALTSNWEEYPSIKVIRLPLVLLGVLNSLLVYFLARQLFKEQIWAVGAGVLFATIPNVVFGSRMVVAENLLTTWFLLALLVLTDTRSAKKTWLLIILSVLAVMTKMSGLVLPLSVIAYGLFSHQKQLLRTGVYGVIAGVGALLAYVSLYNLPLFLAVQAEQTKRDVGLGTLFNRWFLHPTIVRDRFVDGWFVSGLVSFVWLLSRRFKEQTAGWQAVALFGLTLIGFNFLTVGESTFHGWYDYPLWPVFVLALVVLLQYIWQTQNWVVSGVLWLLLLPGIRTVLTYLGVYHEVPLVGMRLIIVLGFVPLALSLIARQSWAKKAQITLWVGLVLINVLTVLTLTHQAHWELQSFYSPLIRF